mmetsp:Transcript_20681/g.26832  ORF Transcript_20681/g.26832 Transcript_20681/m.26832 type:complete len:283 (+) Transcript_20681:375-1223(+)
MCRSARHFFTASPGVLNLKAGNPGSISPPIITFMFSSVGTPNSPPPVTLAEGKDRPESLFSLKEFCLEANWGGGLLASDPILLFTKVEAFLAGGGPWLEFCFMEFWREASLKAESCLEGWLEGNLAEFCLEVCLAPCCRVPVLLYCMLSILRGPLLEAKEPKVFKLVILCIAGIMFSGINAAFRRCSGVSFRNTPRTASISASSPQTARTPGQSWRIRSQSEKPKREVAGIPPGPAELARVSFASSRVEPFLDNFFESSISGSGDFGRPPSWLTDWLKSSDI